MLRGRLRDSLRSKKWNKTSKFKEYIGCDLDYLKSYIEDQFLKDMSWDNYGVWHIDHIIPLSYAKTKEHMYELCHYTNLQPLWAVDNMKKGSKILC